MAIEEVKVRATITIGGLTVETPYVLSFSVTQNRGAPSSMSASLKVKGTSVASANDLVKVWAGTRGNLDRIFTGDLRKMTISPCWDDPSYIILNVEASDVLARLADTKFSRRQHSQDVMFAVITSASTSHKSGRFNTINEPTKFQGTPEAMSPSPAASNSGMSTQNRAGEGPQRREKDGLIPSTGFQVISGGIT